MRIPLTFLAVAGLLASHVAAAQTCARPVDNEAFEVAGLKSQLMVTALTCNSNDKYDAFINTHRPYLIAQDKALNAYFARAHGRQARKQFDDYITQLANSQSQTGLRRGTLFCQENTGIFDELASIKDGSELPDFAAGKTLSQPVSLTTCAAETPKPTAPARRSTTAARKRTT